MGPDAPTMSPRSQDLKSCQGIRIQARWCRDAHTTGSDRTRSCNLREGSPRLPITRLAIMRPATCEPTTVLPLRSVFVRSMLVIGLRAGRPASAVRRRKSFGKALPSDPSMSIEFLRAARRSADFRVVPGVVWSLLIGISYNPCSSRCLDETVQIAPSRTAWVFPISTPRCAESLTRD